MSDQQQQISNQISIQDLELSLQVYQIQSDQKLVKLKNLFDQKGTLDLRQVFYQERSSLEVKFQNIISDLNQFLINQEVPSTQKLRKTFYRILQSPLLLLFKVSRFEIFNLRLNAFDIQLQPIDAICELAKQLYKNIEEYISKQKNLKADYANSKYQSYQNFLQHAKINLIQDQIFILYSYLRKGSNILKKKVEDKIKIAEIFSNIEENLVNILIKNQDVKTLKQLSTLNYEIYLLENSFDVLCFYLKIPFRNIFKEIFKQLESLAIKAKLTCNFDMFINIFVKFNKQILAKINIQKVQDIYIDYIQNMAVNLLQLWGCRICQFRQFFMFFKTLFQIHPDQKKLLQICLKHTPNLSKQDIALIRANYRQNVENKNVELLSLLKKVSLDDINNELNTIYHQILYNLNFEAYTKQTIIDLLTLINQNSSIDGFISTVQKAFKEWNHTIDFNNNMKFIQSQFLIPKNINQTQILQSLKLFSNLCILENKGFNKQFQLLVNKGTINKVIIGLCKFLLTLQQIPKYLKESNYVQTFILRGFKLLQNTLSKDSNQWQQLLQLFANSIKYFSTEQSKKQVKIQICRNIQQNLSNYKLGRLVKILKKTYQFDRNSQTLPFIIDIFMKESDFKNKENHLNKFFHKNIKQISNQLLSQEQINFLKKFACIKNQIVQVKQPSCFKITQLQVITNPIQFQKAMDNYFFTLDQNSKRFIQYIVEQWTTQQASEYNFYSVLIEVLIKKYPICIPILCNIRIKPNQNAKQNLQFRFAEFLVNQLLSKQAQQVKTILKLIIEVDTIKYRNGRDYVVEEIIPMITKRALTLINSGTLDKNNIQPKKVLKIQIYEILAAALYKFKLTDLKIDTIQRSILKINYQIRISKCQKTVHRLSQCFDSITQVFFRKKSLDIKKKNLQQIYKQILWNDIRTYNRTSSSNEQSKGVESQQPLINQQIMVSPYTLSQQYNNQDYKMKKPEQGSNKSKDEQKKIKFSQIIQCLTNVPAQNQWNKSLEKQTSQNSKQIDLSKMKYDIQFYLGKQNIQILKSKQNWMIKQKYQTQQVINSSQNNEKSITFVQYYLRQMLYPQINHQIALKSILAYLKKEIGLSKLWSNPKNLQKIFVPLVILVQYATSNNTKSDISQSLNGEYECWKQIIQYVNLNSIKTIKQILNLLSQLGYHNLWGQNYTSINSYSCILKALSIKIIEEESFLSILLKRTLQFNSLSDIKTEADNLFDKIFSTRPPQQTSLMYKVGIDKNLLNLIMKSLQIKNLSNISFLLHSNFNNLRLYTDQLHQGLKALNIASKTRAYNEYIQLSKQIQDQQFFGPMKLFQENFRFFIKIQKQGFNFKKSQERKLCLQRLINVFRKYETERKDAICQEADKIIQQYQEQIQKLQLSIANRVKSFYLVTKLRDLTYQNSISINLVNQILRQKKVKSQQILKQINKVQVFSLLMTLHKELVRFDNKWDSTEFYQRYNKIDQNFIQQQANFCTTRRFSHSMSKIYEKCDLELDQIIQRCLDQLKLFFSTQQGAKFLQINKSIFYPAFFIKSFVKQEDKIRSQETLKIRQALQYQKQKNDSIIINLKKEEFITDFILQIRNSDKKIFYVKNLFKINFQNKSLCMEQFLETVVKHMIANQTLISIKSKQDQFLTFNKYKTSQATLEEVQALGYILGYCLYHNIKLVKENQSILPLHSSLISAISFNIIDLEDLLHVDFKIWEDLKRILTIQDSKTLNLNFSYIFQNIKTLQNERIQLLDKGASKKVNNLNREEFCDAIACHILFTNLRPQISRLIKSILTIVPKQLLSYMKVSEVYSVFYNKQCFEIILKRYMRKIGIITPELVFREGQKIENLKDYQNVQWASQIILQNQKLREKFWKDESNLLIVTTIGGKSSLRFEDQTLIIQHFDSKQSMSKVFADL